MLLLETEEGTKLCYTLYHLGIEKDSIFKPNNLCYDASRNRERTFETMA